MAKRESANDVFRLLDQMGLPPNYVRSLLPSWWEDTAADSPAGMSEFKVMLARNLGIVVDGLGSKEPRLTFKLPHVRKLKRSIRYSESQLTPAVSIALAAARIAAAACPTDFVPLPDAASLRKFVLKELEAKYVSLRSLIRTCWTHGIPVVHIAEYPDGMPKMDGLVASIQGRPVIVIAKTTDFSAWMSFILAHEIGHIAEGHFQNDELLVDEALTEGSVRSTEPDPEERIADEYALSLLGGVPGAEQRLAATSSATEMARVAMQDHRTQGVDAGHALLRFAYGTGEWGRAVAALKLLDTARSAITDIRQAMMHEIDASLVSDSSLAFLCRVSGIRPGE